MCEQCCKDEMITYAVTHVILPRTIVLSPISLVHIHPVAMHLFKKEAASVEGPVPVGEQPFAVANASVPFPVIHLLAGG